MRIVGREVARVEDPPDVGRAFDNDHRPVPAEVALDARRLEFRDIARIVEFRRRTVGAGGHGVGHDVVRRHDLGVRQIVLNHMRDQLEGGASDSVLHRALVEAVARIPLRVFGVPVGDALLGQLPALVRQFDELHLGSADHVRALAVRQEPVVGRPDQEGMKSRAFHQTSDRAAQTGFLAIADRREFGLGGKPPGEQQSCAAKRPGGRGHRDAIEQRFRRQAPGRGLAPEGPQEPLHVGEVRRSRNDLDASAVGLGPLDLVEDQVGTAFDLIDEALEHREVRCLVPILIRRREHEARMTRRTAPNMAEDAP